MVSSQIGYLILEGLSAGNQVGWEVGGGVGWKMVGSAGRRVFESRGRQVVGWEELVESSGRLAVEAGRWRVVGSGVRRYGWKASKPECRLPSGQVGYERVRLYGLAGLAPCLPNGGTGWVFGREKGVLGGNWAEWCFPWEVGLMGVVGLAEGWYGGRSNGMLGRRRLGSGLAGSL